MNATLQNNTPVATQPHARCLPDLDTVGASASFLCAVHCALMPLAITLLPLLGLGFLANAWVEWALVGLSATLGVSSLCLGFRQHRRRRALAVLGIGLACVAMGRMAEEHKLGIWGVALVVLGGLTLAGAHLLNRHLCGTCPPCSGSDSHSCAA